jgi:hypothetical protein
MAISRQARQEITNRTRDAHEFLARLHAGDRVRVTIDGRQNDMTVSREIRLADGAYGSWESARVTVTLGSGRWSTELIADAIGNGRQAAERLHACPQCGEEFTLPEDTTLTRGSRPCGWSH